MSPVAIAATSPPRYAAAFPAIAGTTGATTGT
jgi:hypothetical protein